MDKLFNLHSRHAQTFLKFESLFHGPSHWERVFKYAKAIMAMTENVDEVVVTLFCAYHDAWRNDDGADPQHGARGAESVWHAIKGNMEISDRQLALLEFAIKYHSDGFTSDDPTIGTCWDADRLDLGRVLIEPDPQYMSTEFAKEMARSWI